MKKSLLVVGLVGVLLGGAAAYAATRYMKPAEGAKADAAAPPATDARQVADAFVAKLKAAKFDEFALDARVATAAVSDQNFASFKSRLDADRVVFSKLYGKFTGEFELLRETAVSPSLVKFAYLEKFENGGVVWYFVLYKGQQSWKLAFVDWSDKLALAFDGV